MINIARLQMADSNTSHWLSRCPVVLPERLLSEIVLLIRIWVFEVCHNLSCGVLSKFEVLNFVKSWVFEIYQTFIWIVCHNFSLSVWSQFKLIRFVKICLCVKVRGPPWILKRGGQESSGQTRISSNGKTKRNEYFYFPKKEKEKLYICI